MPASVDLAYPFTGRWLARNSPADRVPSHGTTRFASSYAIDFVPVDRDGRGAAFSVRALLRPEPVEWFPGYNREILAPVGGVVAAVHDGEPDHPAYRGLPSLGYALTQRRRVARGWRGLAGNHVMIRSGEVIIALCHLRRHSIRVEPGQPVALGQPVAACGNSGNSTEPHLHLQVLDSVDADTARAVRFTLRGSLPRSGETVSA